MSRRFGFLVSRLDRRECTDVNFDCYGKLCHLLWKPLTDVDLSEVGDAL